MRSILSIAAALGALGALVAGLGTASLLGSAGAPLWIWLPAAMFAGFGGGCVGALATMALPLPKPPPQEPPAAAPKLAGAIAEIEALALLREDAPTAGDVQGPPELLAAVRGVAATLAEQRLKAEERRQELVTALDRSKDTVKLLRKRVAEAEEQKQDLLSVQDAFLSRMSHELRTPLNAISGYVDLLLEEADGADTADLNRIRLAALNLTALVTGVLDLTELQSGSYRVKPEPLQFERLVAEVVESVRLTADSQRDTVEVEVEPKLAVVLDKRMTRSILFNLVSNACKYTRDGVVRVRVTGAPDGLAGEVKDGSPCVVLEVSDTGIGMTERQIEAAFRPFSQADESHTRRYDGSGVGLAVVKGFVEAMGGTVRVESEPGKGATVRVVLPVVAFPREPQPLGDDEVTMLLR